MRAICGAAMLGRNDGLELFSCAVGIVVDDDIIIKVRFLIFLSGADQSCLNGAGRIGAASDKTAFQLIQRGYLRGVP